MAREESEKKVAKAISEKREVIKAFEKERVDRKAIEATIREEAMKEAINDIFKYRMNYMRSALFMIKKKYLDLDFFLY